MTVDASTKSQIFRYLFIEAYKYLVPFTFSNKVKNSLCKHGGICLK